MKLPLSNICDPGTHCPTCRSLEGGREWRRTLAENFKTTNPPDFDCPRGLAWGHREQEVPRQTAPARLPRSQWPAEALEMYNRRIPTDRGVGDVMARDFGVPGRLWKWFWKVVGKPCSCDDEQAWLNAMYPFTPEPGSAAEPLRNP